MTRRLFYIASILDVEQIVIHAYFKPDWTVPYNREKDWDRCLEFYLPFVELADKLGIGIAVENFCDVRNRNYFTTQVEEQIEFIKRLDAPHVTACLDTGHSYAIHGKNYINKIKQLGSLITCTHIHDTVYDKDLHLPMFCGEIDWAELAQTLKEIKYSGDINFELKKCNMPDNMLESYLEFIYSSGNEFISMIKSENP